MNRTQLIALSSIVGIVLLGIVIFFLFFSPREAAVDISNTPTFGEGGDRALDASEEELGEAVTTKTEAGTRVAERLIRITKGPVSYGVASVYIPEKLGELATATDGTVTRTNIPADVEVRYIERLSGNVYSFRVHERRLTRISNQTIPGIVESSWLFDGSRAFARYENADGAVETYSLLASTSDGYFLEPGLASAITNGTNELFTLLANSNGSVGTLAKVDGTAPKTLFTSTLSSLLFSYAGTNLLATTKASAQVPGYAFNVSRTNGAFTRLLGPLRGLATLPSPSGTKIVYSAYKNDVLTLTLFDTKTREEISLPLLTLAEKCVWTLDETALYCGASRTLPQGLPDSWYQGASTFTDRIWKVDIENRVAVMTFDPKEMADISVDAVSLTLDSEADTLTFTNRKDGALYVFDL